MLTQQEVKEKLQTMLKKAVHFGHRSFKWNPKMAPFLYGIHNGIHIIDLRKSVVSLEIAREKVSSLIKEGKTILMVSTKPQASNLIKESAERCGMPYVTQKWMSGLLTNYDTIKKRIQYLKKLKEDEKSGEFEKYTKKEALNLRKTIAKLEKALGGVASMSSLPHAVFIADIVKDKIAVKEAKKLGIPTIGIVDSNADPYSVDIAIPGNDDAILSLEYLIGQIEEVIVESKGHVKKSQDELEKSNSSKKEIKKIEPISA